MRICIYTQDISTYLGGVQNVVALVAGRLAESGHDVTILCPDSGIPASERRKLSSGVTLVRTDRTVVGRPSSLGKFILAAAKRAPGSALPRFLNSTLRWAFLQRPDDRYAWVFLQNEEFDVVIGAGFTHSLFISLIAERIDSRTVGWMHSTYDAYFRLRGQTLYGLETLARSSFPKLNSVLVLNSTDQPIFNARLGVSSQVFSNPVEGPTPSAVIPANGQAVIVYVGRINFRAKGIDLLVDAFDRVHAVHSEWKLRVYGDGPDRERLLSLIVERGLHESIELMGSTHDAYSALRSGSIFAFPSRHEGFGIALVEAMRAGLPSVAFATDGPRDILEDGETGFLVERQDTCAFANRIIQLIENPELRNSMGERAAKAAETYDPDRLLPRFVSLIEGG